MKNQIRDLGKEIQNVKTHLQKLEHAIMFGKEMKTIEYLIDEFHEVSDLADDSEEKIRWADLAISLGSDGFKKSLASLEQMMDGTSHVFAEGSIFNTIVSDENFICTDLKESSEYFFSLWTIGHALWANAYRVKNSSFEENARKLKRIAQSKIVVFETARDDAYPDHCD